MSEPIQREPLVGEAHVRWALGPRSADFGHLAHHVAKVAGIACGLAEKMEHGDRPKDAWNDFDCKRLPDLMILAAMMAQWRGLDLSALVEARGQELVNRV